MANTLRRQFSVETTLGYCENRSVYIPARPKICYTETKRVKKYVYLCTDENGNRRQHVGVQEGEFCVPIGEIWVEDTVTTCDDARPARTDTIEVCYPPVSRTVPASDWQGSAQSDIALESSQSYTFTANVAAGVVTGFKSGQGDWTNRSLNDVLFGIRIFGGAAGVVESGELGPSTSFSVGDSFEIRRIRHEVRYYKNGSLFYTSTKSASGLMRVAGFLYTTGDEIDDPVYQAVHEGIADVSEQPDNAFAQESVGAIAVVQDAPEQAIIPYHAYGTADVSEQPDSVFTTALDSVGIAQQETQPDQADAPLTNPVFDLGGVGGANVSEAADSAFGIGISGNVGYADVSEQPDSALTWNLENFGIAEVADQPDQAEAFTYTPISEFGHSVIQPQRLARMYGIGVTDAGAGVLRVRHATLIGYGGAESFIKPVNNFSLVGTGVDNVVGESAIQPLRIARLVGLGEGAQTFANSFIRPQRIASLRGYGGAESFIKPQKIASLSGTAEAIRTIAVGNIKPQRIAKLIGTGTVSTFAESHIEPIRITRLEGYGETSTFVTNGGIRIASLIGVGVIPSQRVTYAINTKTGATTRYTVGFIRLARMGDRHFGLLEDGTLCLLDGHDYNGQLIDAFVRTFPTDLDSPFKKRNIKSYVDARTTGEMTVVAVTDEDIQNTVTTIHAGDAGIQNHPFKPGRGLTGQRWAYGFQSFDDFTIARLYSIYQPLSRRIY